MNEDLDLFAAEYVLGTLDGADRRRAAGLVLADPAFRRAVEDWERRLRPLGEGVPSVAPQRDLWTGIARRLDAATHAMAPTNDNHSVAALHRSRARWRIATLFTGAMAAALAAFVLDRSLLRPRADQPGAYFAAVNRGGDMPALIVRVDLAAHSVTVRPVEAETPPGKSLELWMIAAGQKPKSMGLVAKNRETMPMPADMPTRDTMFAVSVEPPGGSPSGAPTGPVIYKGALIPE